MNARPWGEFQQHTLNEQTTVKIISVSPGHRLSLQMHENRAEFWQVLSGKPRVSVADKTWTAEVGQQVWVQRGVQHRIANPTDEIVSLLEIGYGAFDENDIVRLDDDYRR